MTPAGSLPTRAALAAAAVFLGLWAPGPAGAQERFRRTPPPPDPRPLELRLPAVERTVLPNGLTVAVAVRPEASLVTLQLVIRAGEADAPPERPAVATAAARLIGRGTKMLSADYLQNSIEAIGADLRVTVLMDYTVLTMHVLEEYLDRAFYLLRLVTLEALFTERELGAVRRTLYWELFERKKDPEVLAWGQLLRLLFAGHAYATGTYAEDVIKFISVRDVTAFYDRFYRPGNAAVLVSGPVDADTVRQRVEGHFGAWTGQSPGRPAAARPACRRIDHQPVAALAFGHPGAGLPKEEEMRLSRALTTIDTHTAGGPTRTITAGLPPLQGETVAEKMEYFRTHFDSVRKLLMSEPRGHRDMSGAVITEPTHPDADLGVFFLTASGYLPACVHSTIGVAVAGLETGFLGLASDRPDVVSTRMRSSSAQEG